MADATITKNIGNVNCYSTLTWTYYTEFQTWVNTGRTTGSNTVTVDLSAIPADAEIINATYNSSYYETLAGTGYQTIRKPNGDMWDYANSAKLKQWLVAGNRTVKIMYSYTPNEQAPRGGSAGVTSAYRQYRGVALSVVYEAGNKTWLLHYGSGDEWKPVVARGGKDGEWKPVYAYMGVNGGWTLCEKTDIGD